MLNENMIKELKNICGEDYIKTSPENLKEYSQDKTDYVYMPDLVVIPKDTEEVSKIMKLCNDHNVKITPMGRKTGLSGSALAVEGGIILSMERFDKIIKIDEDNYQIIVEPYVKNYEIQIAVKEKGLFYPPDPASYRICSIGGNVAMSSGGPKAVKYGCTREYVLNLEVVLASGEVINTGANVIKNSNGYNLTHLMVGSEGTLGVITKIVLKLIPNPKYDVLMFASFTSLKDACQSVNTIMNTGIIPSGVELMERKAILYAREYCKSNFPDVSDKTQAHLLIELDGNDLVELQNQINDIKSLIEKNHTEHLEMIYIPKDENERKNLWVLRRSVYSAIHSKNIVKEMDIVVPRASMAAVVERLTQVSKEYSYDLTAYGHAGDGNLHIGIISLENSDVDRIHQGVRKSFEIVCKEYGGLVSGEHGIGIAQKDFLGISCSEVQIELMKGIKKVFDPKNILNPGKIF